MEKTTLYLPEDMAAALRQASRSAGRPQAELVREALRAYLEQLRPEPPRSIGSMQDPGLAAADSERWLEERWREDR